MNSVQSKHSDEGGLPVAGDPLSLPQSATLKRIPSLDGLRMVSIALVISLHMLQRFSLAHRVPWYWYGIFDGTAGVFIFFVISGFLITTLLLKEREKRGSISLRGFYLRRAFRILPPLYLYILVIVLIGVSGRIALIRENVLSAIFFYHNVTRSQGMWSLEHLWSISLEEQFYFVWPFLLALSLRRPGVAGRYLAARIPIAILIVSPLIRTFLGHSSHPEVRHFALAYFNFDYIMFGCLIALLQHTPTFESIYERATRVWWIPLAVIVLCNLLGARFQNYFNLTVGYTIEGAAIGLFLLWLTRNSSTPIGKFLNWRPIVWLGVVSYSIYIWQTLFLHHANSEVFGNSTWASSFPGNLLCILLAASASYYLVEQPSLRLRDRVIRRLHVYQQSRRTALQSRA